jgi:CubicO group peptidase (beta-lactamase class C family)
MMRRWSIPLCVLASLIVGLTATGPATAAPVREPVAPDQSAGGVGEAGADSVVEGPPTATPNEIRFRRDVLRPGTARQAGLLPGPVDALRGIAESYLGPTPDHQNWPTYAGATVLAAHHGVVVQRFAVGYAVRYSEVGPPPLRTPTELPPDQRIPAKVDTIYDLASVSKLFTTIVLLQQVERKKVDLDVPVARYVPEFAAGGKETVTVKHLLTHTSGLPAFLPFYSTYPTPQTRLAAALTTPVTAGSAPGNQYVYSDIGLIALGELIHRVTGKDLATAVRDSITAPLAMRDTGYNPGIEKRNRVAATEYQPYVNRGMVWGEVHDENAWALGGVSGHAGLFSTADDLAILCQMLLDGGTYKGKRILGEATVRQALVNYNAGIEERYPDSDRGLGFELAKHSYMDAMASPVTFGHTGFTGTSIVVDPLAQSFLIVLSNRVHPDRGWGTNTVARRALARSFADAHPVRPVLGGTAWRTQRRDNATVTLTAPLRSAAGPAAIASFLLWYDTEPRFDTVLVETSPDGGTNWVPATMSLRTLQRRFTAAGSLTGYGGREWWAVSAPVPAGTTHLRWSYRTDTAAQGRGVYTDHVLVLDPRTPGGVLFAGEGGDAGMFVADGWAPSDS